MNPPTPSRRKRILYVHSTVVPPPTDLRRDRFYLLSENLEGDILQPIWFQTPAEVEAMFGEGSYPVYTVGNFRYHWLLSSNMRGMRQRYEVFRSYLSKGRQLYKERRFDCIVAYSHMTTGVLAGILRLLTGARLVIELVTSPRFVYITDRPNPTLRERLMKVYSDVCLHVSTVLANRFHFLFPNQLSDYPLLQGAANSVFHEFVPISAIERGQPDADDAYVLLVGAPWYLKGVDLLIRAFRSIEAEFPSVKLKILGYFPDRTAIDALMEGSRQIEILKARPPAEALKIIEGAMMMVLPSRCEGLPRVLIEGMAAGLPLVGSTVGGIPYLIRNGENGFAVPIGDWQALAAQMRVLLQDAGLRRKMGYRSYERAHSELNEQVYVREFTRMIEAAVNS